MKLRFKKINTLKIDRSKWRTGDTNNHSTGEGETKLLNDEGFMCCLGFYCVQAGVPKKLIKNENDPEDVVRDKKIKDIPRLSVDECNTDFASKAMQVNDGNNRPHVREKRIKKLFKKEGVNVIFSGKYPEPIPK